jgi:anti-sigma factor RsiW
MAISIEATPNPNALKFSIGQDVGGPRTYVAGRPVDDPMSEMLLALAGVTSVFMTADFVTLTKAPDADWMLIAEQAQKILEGYFDAT